MNKPCNMTTNGYPPAAKFGRGRGRTEKNKSDAPKRGKWGNGVEFILSCLGYAVGLGNVWRFPYICYTNGGGAFLIPYALTLTFVGIPAFFLELIMGQYSGCGPLTIWSISPLFQGIGAGMIFITCMLCIFYTMLMGYTLYYFVLSFFDPLPWDSCHHSFNTPNCYSLSEVESCRSDNGTWFNRTCYYDDDIAMFDEVHKITDPGSQYQGNTTVYNLLREQIRNHTAVSSSEEYFNLGVLEMSSSINETGTLKWKLAMALLAAWILCFICIIKGIHSSGKVVYFTSLFPYVVLVIFFIRGVTLEGSIEGIMFFITPDWEKLKHAKVWGDAAVQIFFSLSVGGGGLMTLASYNRFNNNIYRDALIVSIGNCLTSVFAGFVIFSILGHMAYVLKTPVSKVVAEGSTLVFVAYPQIMTRFPVPQVWSVLFFLMLITLGLDSIFAAMETAITATVDAFPKIRRYKTWVTLCVCCFFFLIGLIMCTNAGMYWLALIAYYSTGWSLILMGLAELIVFTWIYGAARVIEDVQYMSGIQLYSHWWICWVIITPTLLIVVLVLNVLDFKPLAFGPNVLPTWAQQLGWAMTLCPVAMIILVIIVRVLITYVAKRRNGYSLAAVIVKLTQPTADWKPSTMADETKLRSISQSTSETSQTYLAATNRSNPSHTFESRNPTYDTWM